MDRSSFVRALALTIGVAGSFSSLANLAQAGQCDNCDSPTPHRCQCPPGRGLLDTLNDVACKVVKDQPRRKSVLQAFQFSMKITTDCDKASCGCEPACGAEPSCGTEPTCGTESSCGVEASCGAETGCGVEPSCGTEPKCGIESRSGLESRPAYTHAMGPIQYPGQPGHSGQPGNPGHSGHGATPALPRPVQTPAHTPARPPAAPENTIPTPVPQDSTIDPFKDDTVSHSRVRARSASQRISSHASTPPVDRALRFDPQAAARSGQVGPQRVIVRKSPAAPARGHVADDLPMDDTTSNTSLGESSSRSQSRSNGSFVLPASAAEPAKLPPLKTNSEPFDLSSSRNPLRD